MIERVTEVFLQSDAEALPDLATLRERITKIAFKCIILFASPVILFSLIRALKEGWTWYFTVQLSLYGVFVACYPFAKSIPNRVITNIVVGNILIIGVCGVAAWGPAPSRFVLLVCACVISSIVCGSRHALASIGLAAVGSIFAASFYSSLGIADDGDSVSSHSVRQWAVSIAIFTLYTTAVCLISSWMMKSLQATISTLRQREAELEHSNALLSQQAAQLQEQAALLEEQAQTLTEERDRAESATRAKDQFLSIVSHELRTPLNPILGFLDILSDDPSLSQESRQQLALMNRSGEHLQHLVDQVVDYSELEHNQLSISPQRVLWEELRSAICARLKTQALNKQLEFQVIVEPDGAEALRVDRRRLLQILDELGGNAIRFTDKGSVTVRLTLDRAKGEDHSLLTIVVSDTGPGIPEKILPKLFDPFSQAHLDKTRESCGFGLGLSICERLCNAMGGEIEVDSALGRGTEVTVRLPVKSYLATPGKTASPAAKPRFESEPHILVVEDDFVNQRVVTSLLKKMSARSTCVDNGEKAIAAVENGTYDLVLMDISMPVMDGLAATKAIRKDPRHSELPIVALTAHSYASSENACYEAGMNAFLTKPVKAPLLYEAISSCLAEKKTDSNSAKPQVA
ncbi:ATP-binding protein [Pelagicoccus sp. SDUM812003]|uniref:ATP-binding protein n=1 Tax=Pelagicoccus sp. SDUM812003 TaxID=3041267 RepID=UPI00280EBFD7|nr:ATP-binding protein [Pelagicoccus sp. SDUM812003]MDQ8202845.1 ATP-binding protein [Pelagicoccus sp. SDUM812003]